MALSTSERAAYGYRGRSAGMDKALDTSSIERGFREQQRRGERKEDQQTAIAEKLGALYDYDLMKPLGEDLMNDINKLQQDYIDGNISQNEALMQINGIKQKGNNYEYATTSFRAAADPNSTDYVIVNEDGNERYLSGAEKLNYFADLSTRGGEDAEMVFNTIPTINTGQIPEKDAGSIVMDKSKIWFDLKGQEMGLRPEDIARVKSLNSIDAVYSFLKTKKVNPEDIEAFTLEMKSDPKFQDAIRYQYKTTPLVQNEFEDENEFADYVIGGMTKTEEQTSDREIVTDRNKLEELRKARDEEEEELPKYTVSEITEPPKEGEKEIDWIKTIAVGVFGGERRTEGFIPEKLYYKNKEVSEEEASGDLAEWSKGKKIKVVTIPESERGKERLLDTDTYGQPQKYLINSDGDILVVGAKTSKNKEDGYVGSAVPVVSEVSKPTAENLMANTKGLDLNYFEESEQESSSEEQPSKEAQAQAAALIEKYK